MRASNPGIRHPDEPKIISEGWVELTTVDVSVKPISKLVLFIQDSNTGILTISLSDGDLGVGLLEVGGCLHSERRRASEETLDRAQIIL